MTEQTINAELYEFSLGGHGDETTHVGLHITHDGTRTTLALPIADAEIVGRMLVSHADYVNGRPPRDW
jgi:hypothetical protein